MPSNLMIAAARVQLSNRQAIDNMTNALYASLLSEGHGATWLEGMPTDTVERIRIHSYIQSYVDIATLVERVFTSDRDTARQFNSNTDVWAVALAYATVATELMKLHAYSEVR
jgi:hypothetical protein